MKSRGMKRLDQLDRIIGNITVQRLAFFSGGLVWLALGSDFGGVSLYAMFFSYGFYLYSFIFSFWYVCRLVLVR